MGTTIESSWENTRLSEEITTLRQRVAELEAESQRLKFALAETEALEMSHGERIEKLTAERDAALARLGESITFDDKTAFEWLGEKMFDMQNATGCNTAEEYTGELENLKSALREVMKQIKEISPDNLRGYNHQQQIIATINTALGEEK